MKNYGQFCPIARGAEVFAERWTPIILRNLLLGCRTFTDILDGAPGLSRTLLSQRLRLLEKYGIVERRPAARGSTYHLTACGIEFGEVVTALGSWGARWLEVAPQDLDAGLVVWTLGRLIDKSQLPARRIVVRFDLTDDVRPNRYWLILTTADSEVCVTPPGYSDDLRVTTNTPWLTKWHLGWVSLGEAQRAGQLCLDGPGPMVRAFRQWGGRSPFAHLRPAVEQPLMHTA
jgi:DNA-binding HxlR family transcriptional regulator